MLTVKERKDGEKNAHVTRNRERREGKNAHYNLSKRREEK